MKARSLVAALVLAGVARMAPAGSQAEPATKPADRVAPFLKVIREAEDYRTVMRAYARATAIDRNDVRIHKTYMRRMLRLGLPQIAYYPALTLTKLDPNEGMAWGVVGYMHGRREELTEAFTATIWAVEKLPDDASILHNAGQLVAWYDTDPSLPRVPDSARRALAGMRGRLAQSSTFAHAYRSIVEAYKQQAEAAADLEKRLAAAEIEANAVRRLAQEVDNQLRDLNDEIDYRNRLIDDLGRELRYYYGYGYYRDYNGTYLYYPPRRYDRRELLGRIRDEERAVEALKLKVRQVRREGRAVLGELAAKQTALDRIREEFGRQAARVERQFRWDPPAVDGVVTAELDGFPPATGPASVELPEDPESEAAQRLDLARLYVRHEMGEKAVEILKEVVARYGATEAGRQARLLLGAMKPVD